MQSCLLVALAIGAQTARAQSPVDMPLCDLGGTNATSPASCECRPIADAVRGPAPPAADDPRYRVELIRWRADGLELRLSEPIADEERVSADTISVLLNPETPAAIQSVVTARQRDVLQIRSSDIGALSSMDVQMDVAPLSAADHALAVARWHCSRQGSAPTSRLNRLDFAPVIPMNTLSAAERRRGWVALFDGRSLAGWRPLTGGAMSPYWRVEQGAIHLVGLDERRTAWDSAGMLRSTSTHADFELRLEWKIAFGGNSGVFYHLQSPESAAVADHFSGLEYQLLDDRYAAEGALYKHRAGDLYDLIGGAVAVARYPGEWNSTRIIVEGGPVEHWLNGRRLLAASLDAPEFRQAIAASKFASYPAFGKARSGFIGLQDHEAGVWFRNIRVREIDAR